MLINLISKSLIYTSNVVKIVRNKTSSQNIKKQIQINFASMFQLINITIIISKINVKIISKKSYEKSQKSIKFLIKNFLNKRHLNKKIL